jgi:predicted PurR-regulated permease PerM
MSETGTEQVKEVETAQAPQDELLKIARKQLFFQRISAVCMVVVTLAVVFAVIRVVPQVETTLNHINNVALKAQDSLAQVDDMTDGLIKASENLNKLVDDNAEELTNAVRQIS